MIENLKPYSEYKESGLAWVGKVPAHWELMPNRGLLRRRKMLVGEHHSSYRLLSLTKLGIIVRDMSKGKGKFSSDMGTSQEVRPGDLVFCLFDVPETPRTVGLSRHNGMITGAYTVFECRNIQEATYIEHFYRAMDDRKLLSPLYSGLRNTIQPERFLGIKTPFPPPTEQAAIVRFLDWANGRLDRTILAKRKVIALLNEQKQAIIHRAVTRGLDPSVPLKDSGVPWLGEIPEHWEVRRLKQMAHLQSGNGITSLEIESEGSFPVYGGNGLRGYTNRYTHEGSYALIGRQGALCGNVNFVHGKFFASEHAVVPTLIPDICVNWFGHLLRIMNLNQYSQSAAQPGLAVERINNLYMPFPPVSEQHALSASFERDTAPIVKAISRLNRELDLLREYRTRLVADVVTGKLDVREAASRLPEQAAPEVVAVPEDWSDETEPVDDEITV